MSWISTYATLVKTNPFNINGESIVCYPSGYLPDWIEPHVYSFGEYVDCSAEPFKGKYAIFRGVDQFDNIENIITNNTYVPEYIFTSGEYLPVMAIKGAFQNSNAQFVFLPDRIQCIDDYSFENASEIETLTFPINLTYIGAHAFAGMNCLRDLYFRGPLPPSMLIELTPQFYDIVDMEQSTDYKDFYFSPFGRYDTLDELAKDLKIHIPEGSESFYHKHQILRLLLGNYGFEVYSPQFAYPENPNSQDGLEFGKSYMHELEVLGYRGNEEELIIPSEVYSDDVEVGVNMREHPYNVTGIGYKSFFQNSSLKKVTIAGNLKYVKGEAFDNSTIEHIIFGGKIENVGRCAFTNLTNLQSVTILPCDGEEDDWTRLGNIFAGISKDAVLYYDPSDKRVNRMKAPFDVFKTFVTMDLKDKSKCEEIDHPKISVSSTKNGVTIVTNTESACYIYGIDGRCVYSEIVKSGENNIPMSNGLYIVKIENSSFKIYVN